MCADWVWNYQMAPNGPFIKDRTAHLVREVDGLFVTTECGRELQIQMRNREEFGSGKKNLPRERHRCGNCPWPEVDE